MSVLRHLALLVFFSLSAAACTASSKGTPTGSTCPQGSTLTYESFGQAFIQANCLACHARQQPALATLVEVRSASAEIDQVAAAGPNATNTIMPEDHSVSNVACGAP